MTSKTDNGFELDSFERFSDKLCEELISYLSISDKIRLECVSKQWKSLIFNKQKSIVINYYEDRKDWFDCSFWAPPTSCDPTHPIYISLDSGRRAE